MLLSRLISFGAGDGSKTGQAALTVDLIDNVYLTPGLRGEARIRLTHMAVMAINSRTIPLTLLSGCSFALCLSAWPSSASEVIAIKGSSTVYPITARAIKQFQQTSQGRSVQFSLKETGSSAGFREFCNGKIPVANASRPISKKEISACTSNNIRFIELPIAFDAITIAVNKNNNWVTSITTKELERLWNRKASGSVTRWNQVNHDFPDRPIKLCGPGKDSGTYDIFNKAINGSLKNSRSDYTASENDNVLVDCVIKNQNALAYFGFGYFKKNSSKLRALKVVNPKGNPVAPSIANVQKELYQPLSRPLFLYVNDRMLNNDKSLRNFVAFYLRRAESLVKEASYIPLPSRTYRLVESKLYRHILGSSFSGTIPVGLTIGQVLEQSFDQHKKPAYR